MTIDDVPGAVEEADRLGALLHPDYKPSDIFNHERLEEAYKHAKNDCDRSSCQNARFWDVMTANRFFAWIQVAEVQRDDLDDALDPITTGEDFMGTYVQVFSGLFENTEEEIDLMQQALDAWMIMRIQQIMEGVTDSTSGEVASRMLMFEGFMAGMMFAQAAERLRA